VTVDSAGALIFGAATVALAASFVVLERLVRTKNVPTEITRRVAHVLACLFALLVHAVLPIWTFLVCSIAFAALIWVSRHFHVFTSIHKVRRRSLGDVYLPLGIGIAALLALDDAAVFVAAVLVLGLADVAAGLVGDYLRSTRKTWWGSGVFLAVSIVVLAFCGLGPLAVLVVAVLATATERYSPLGTDNLSIPLVVAGVLLLL
jgi:phytol kinase